MDNPFKEGDVVCLKSATAVRLVIEELNGDYCQCWYWHQDLGLKKEKIAFVCLEKVK